MIGDRHSWNNIEDLMNAELMGKSAIASPELQKISESELFFYAFQICPLLYLLYNSENSGPIDLIRDLDSSTA